MIKRFKILGPGDGAGTTKYEISWNFSDFFVGTCFEG
jgi:hypothetical protein